MHEMLTIKGMHVGEQNFHATDEDLVFCGQLGVEYIGATPPGKLAEGEDACWYLQPLGNDLGFPFSRGQSGQDLEGEGYWNLDLLLRFRERIESFGLKWAMSGLPRWPSIGLGTSERDRDIEKVCKCIEIAAKAGIPILGCGVGMGLGVVRSPGWVSGRGAIMQRHFDYEEIKNEPLHPAGPISAEQAWERIEYFIKRVVPVAEEYKVKLAWHPNDVPVPPGTPYRGIAPVLNNIDGLKHLIDLHPSPYHGLLFCQGCVSEFSTEPEQVYEAIRYFGSRKKIFWVHFRNIRGGLLKFAEAFPDDGDIDMVKALRIYKEVGYNGVLVPDHVPLSAVDTRWGHRAHAFCIGYIKALIQAVELEN